MARRRGGVRCRCGSCSWARPDFAVPTLIEIVGRGHEVVAVYTRAPKPAGRRGLDLTPSPVEREARRFALPVLTPADPARRRTRRALRAPRRGRGGRRRLWAHPAEADPRSMSARCLQPACFAAAALARRRADQPRDHGGRCRDRRDGDEDGGGARHRPDRHGRARADRPRTRPRAICTIGSPASAPISWCARSARSSAARSRSRRSRRPA